MRADALARLHAQMAAHVASGEVPGLVTLIAQGDEVHVDVLGTHAAQGAGGALRRDSIFRVTSMTKPVAAAAAMILVDDGKLRLDEPVDRLLPELATAPFDLAAVACPVMMVPAEREPRVDADC